MDAAAPSLHGRRPPRASPPPPPRVLRSSASALGMALVAALDEPPARAPAVPHAMRPRSDSTLSSDTFDGIYALDDDVGAVDVDDVDMDDLACEADAFRPSALMDRKLEDEFGRASDLERMLSALDGGASVDAAVDLPDVQGMEVDDDEAVAVMAHLAQLDTQQKNAAKTAALGQSAQLLLPAHGTRRVVVQPVGDADSLEAVLPPRAAPSDTKRRAHKRTFGERAATFRFGVASTSSPVKVTAASSLTAVIVSTTGAGSRVTTTTTTRAPTTATRRARSLFREAAEDIAGRRDVAPERDDKENKPPLECDVDDETMQAESEERESGVDVEIKNATHPLDPAQTTPLRAVPATMAFAASASFHTPLRRSSGLSTATDASAFLTPIVAVASSAPYDSTTHTTHAVGAISPAPTFDKVAVVHAKDTPGKVDKFEWTIRRGARPAAASPEQAVLPPPYLRDATTSSAAPKRRVHSSTFGSFARSFSFTSP